MEEEEQSQLDNRNSQRISLQQPVVVKLDSGLVVRGKTVNVSKGGFFVVDPDTAPMIFKGEKGSITLTHAEESHTFPCMVAWTRDDGFGITVLEDKRKFTRLARDLVRWKLDQRLSRLNHMRQEVDQIMGFGTLYRFAKWVSVVVSLSVLVVAGVIYSYFGEGLAVMPIHHMGRMEESVQIKEYPFPYTKSLSLLLPGQTIFIHGKVEWLDWLVVSREDRPDILGYIPASTSVTRLLEVVDTPLVLPIEEKSKPSRQSSKQPPAQPEVGEEWYHPSGITFVWIPPGMGFMGQGTLEKEELTARYGPALVEYLYSDETPVFLSMPGFWMGKHEVTEAQYRRFIRESGYISRSELAEGCQTLVDEEWSMGSGVHWRKTGLNSGPDYPVVCVDLLDIEEFLKWLNQQAQGVTFTLPSEYQWEYASRRSKQETPYYWQGGTDAACQYENIADQSLITKHPERDGVECSDHYATLAPIGRFPPNPNGLHDMLGNAREWSCSRYESRHNMSDLSCQPWVKDQLYTIKGGSWFTGPGGFRSGKRSKFSPDHRDITLGFRVVAIPEKIVSIQHPTLRIILDTVFCDFLKNQAQFRMLPSFAIC